MSKNDSFGAQCCYQTVFSFTKNKSVSVSSDVFAKSWKFREMNQKRKF